MLRKFPSRCILVSLGAIFIISAVSKLISIDSFEIYIYSFGLFNLNLSFIFARLLIGVELLLGICLVLSAYARLMIYLSLAMLAGFTCFLTYLLITGKKEHCHCFGEFVELSHIWSIVKNIILCGLFISIIRIPFKNIRFSHILLPVIILTGLSFPFIYSIPDNFNTHKTKQISYNEELFNTFLSENPQLIEDRKVVSFISTGCRFCKLVSKKLTVISEKANNTEDIFYGVWGNENLMDHFFNETNSFHFKCTFIDPHVFIRLTDGKMPLILLLENGKVVEKYDYRDIQDTEIIDFLSSNPSK